MESETDFLSQVPIFSRLRTEDLSWMAQRAHSRIFPPGEEIIREGDQDGRLFVILRGQVEVVKGRGTCDETSLATLGPTDYFGEMALLDDMVRSATVLARKETLVLELGQSDLRAELERNPSMAFELLRMLSQRVRAIEKSLVRTLGGLLPICAKCKAIRDENGSWIRLETYIEDHSGADFTHGICPECAKRLYPRLAQVEP
jgi:CRP/FNR family cyclic AMP-dependent transcriptional regulator